MKTPEKSSAPRQSMINRHIPAFYVELPRCDIEDLDEKEAVVEGWSEGSRFPIPKCLNSVKHMFRVEEAQPIGEW